MGVGDGIIVGIVGVNEYNYEIWNSNLRILTYDYITHLLVELQPQVTASMFWWYHGSVMVNWRYLGVYSVFHVS